MAQAAYLCSSARLNFCWYDCGACLRNTFKRCSSSFFLRGVDVFFFFAAVSVESSSSILRLKGVVGFILLELSITTSSSEFARSVQESLLAEAVVALLDLLAGVLVAALLPDWRAALLSCAPMSDAGYLTRGFEIYE